MANVATQQVVRAGLTPAYVAADAAGDQVRPGPSTFLHVKNGSAASVTVTVVTHKSVEGLDLADLAVAVPAGGERMIGPITDDLFRDPADGLADITWSAAASVTFAVVTS
jgi:Trk K+ transport system NAD-binding subunit